MRRSTSLGIVFGMACALFARTPAHATILVVDDDNVPCFNAPYHNINEALAFAEAGDEIQVCPGLYPEQVVLTKPLTLRGLPVGSQKAVIQPTALLATRPSTMGGKLVTAGIIVDAPRVVLDSLVLDMSLSNATGCAPAVAGIYLRNASGVVENVTESGALPATTPDCDSGVGMLIEGGQAGDIFGHPLFGKAVVAVRDSSFTNNSKGGMVFLGSRAIIKVSGTQVLGTGPAATVQNGIEFGLGARGRMQEVQVRDFQTTTVGKTATGVLLFGAAKVRIRRSTITDAQTGVFVVGNFARVLDTQLGDITSDAIVLLGKKNRVLSALIDVSSVSGVFIDGDRNTVRGGNMTDMPVGVWFFDGDRNIAKGIDFTNVPERERVGGVRDLTSDAVDPFTLDCATVADCDDGNTCTTDACDALAGTCNYTNLPDLTSCSDGNLCNGDEVCVAGVCHLGTPLVCVDGNPCTNNLCDPASGCQFPNYPDLTPCADADQCNGTEFCLAGVCTPGLPAVCNDNNVCTNDSCDPAIGCVFTPVPDATPCPDTDACNGAETCVAGLCTPGLPLVCNDLNACTADTCDATLGCVFTANPPCDDINECTSDTCDALAGCVFTPVPDLTPCNGGLGTCTAGVCL